jgi:chromosome segregation protein
MLARRNERDLLLDEVERAAQQELAAKTAVEQARSLLGEAEAGRGAAEDGLREAERVRAETAESVRSSEWLIERRRAAPAEGPLAVRRAEIEGELAAERRRSEQLAAQRRARQSRRLRLRAQREADLAALPLAERLSAAIALAGEGVAVRLTAVEAELAEDRRAGEEMAGRLRECAAEEAGIQSTLRAAGEVVTESEVAAQRLRDQAAEAEIESAAVAERLGLAGSQDGEQASAAAQPARETPAEPSAEAEPEPLAPERRSELEERVQRLTRRREQLGPVNPLAQDEYAEAVEHVEELETQRSDLETALRELRTLIKETDRQIEETFAQTFEAAAKNFEELVGDVFPGGSGRLRLVEDEQVPRPVLGGQALASQGEEALEAAADAEAEDEAGEQQLPGVEIEITPAGKSTKRLTLLSGGEKSMTALAFLFAVFLARPCPFYILDEVEAALDDLNLDRFLALLRRYAGRAQFIVITHQKRTMEAADWLFGVSMGGDGVSKVLSRRLPGEQPEQAAVTALAS